MSRTSSEPISLPSFHNDLPAVATLRADRYLPVTQAIQNNSRAFKPHSPRPPHFKRCKSEGIEAGGIKFPAGPLSGRNFRGLRSAASAKRKKNHESRVWILWTWTRDEVFLSEPLSREAQIKFGSGPCDRILPGGSRAVRSDTSRWGRVTHSFKGVVSCSTTTHDIVTSESTGRTESIIESCGSTPPQIHNEYCDVIASWVDELLQPVCRILPFRQPLQVLRHILVLHGVPQSVAGDDQ
eukprot:756581-Hanusia_phi.AAC.1